MIAMNTNRFSTPTSVRMTRRTRARLIDLAKRRGVTPSNLVRAALIAKLSEWENKGITLARLP